MKPILPHDLVRTLTAQVVFPPEAHTACWSRRDGQADRLAAEQAFIGIEALVQELLS